jgi:ketopantoate reductase
VVLGCGAIGGTVAAGLARDGHDVLISWSKEAYGATLAATAVSDLPGRRRRREE